MRDVRQLRIPFPGIGTGRFRTIPAIGELEIVVASSGKRRENSRIEWSDGLLIVIITTVEEPLLAVLVVAGADHVLRPEEKRKQLD